METSTPYALIEEDHYRDSRLSTSSSGVFEIEEPAGFTHNEGQKRQKKRRKLLKTVVALLVLGVATIVLFSTNTVNLGHDSGLEEDNSKTNDLQSSLEKQQQESNSNQVSIGPSKLDHRSQSLVAMVFGHESVTFENASISSAMTNGRRKVIVSGASVTSTGVPLNVTTVMHYEDSNLRMALVARPNSTARVVHISELLNSTVNATVSSLKVFDAAIIATNHNNTNIEASGDSKTSFCCVDEGVSVSSQVVATRQKPYFVYDAGPCHRG